MRSAFHAACQDASHVFWVVGGLKLLMAISLMWSLTTASQAKSGSAQIHVSTDGRGVKGFTLGDRPFVPVGVNYLIEGHPISNGLRYQTFDMFDVRSFDLATIDRALAQISSNKFTYVRLWLKGADTDEGFAATDQWQRYVGNVVATIHDARKHGLHVVLTGSFPGPTGHGFVPKNYAPKPSAIDARIAGSNRLLLDPAYRQALGRFYFDLLTALTRADPAIASDMFYFDLYNEIHYDLLSLPLSRTSGSVRYGGIAYSLSDYSTDDAAHPASRQAMMDRATTEFVKSVGGRIKSAMPGLLVTASTGYNLANGHKAFDGGAMKSLVSNNYMPRPYALWKGGADLLDIHTYPTPTYNPATAFISDEIVPTTVPVSGTMINAEVLPFIAGEFGALTKAYPLPGGLQRGVASLKSIAIGGLCRYGFAGYGVWDWNSHPSSAFVLLDPTNDPDLLFLRAIAPTYVQTLCGRMVSETRTLSADHSGN